ncbi:hypothetical protein MN116_008713 [Schistosoma mekongi]|uniref:Uncharacterized protein n=1 Tax=Schistosoma mekongi TaxID=38744 RepID=A0AAE2D1L2_SCHME|nr:hypothetical protein MN116_008713 [Schistosoma mekongi]
MFNIKTSFYVILIPVSILTYSMFMEKSEALKCYVCQNCTNVTTATTTIFSNCTTCQQTIKVKNGILNATTRACLVGACNESTSSLSPWVNTTTCCSNYDLCNRSVRISSEMNIHLIWTLFGTWKWYKWMKC